MSDGNDDKKTKEDHIIDFITKFAHYEYVMEPYKQGKRDLRNSYRDNKWLTTEDMQQAVRAYRAIQKDIDLDELQNFRNLLVDKVDVNED